MAAPQVCGPQTQEEYIAGRLEFSSKDCAAHHQVSDRRRTRASERVAAGHLRWTFQTVPAAQDSFFFVDDFSLGPALLNTMHPAAYASQVASHGFRQGVSHGRTGAPVKGLHHAVTITARLLRAPLVERVGFQVDAPFLATRLLLVFLFPFSSSLLLTRGY